MNSVSLLRAVAEHILAGDPEAAARLLGAAGMFAIPLNANKRPLVAFKHRHHDITKRWSMPILASEIPGFSGAEGIGIATGPSTWCILDADNEGAVLKIEADLQARGLKYIKVQSSPGKAHFYGRARTAYKFHTYGVIGNGGIREPEIKIDLCCSNHYVALPGSMHKSGTPYHIVSAPEDGEVDYFDEYVAELVREIQPADRIRDALYRLAGYSLQDGRDLDRLRIRRLSAARSKLANIHVLPDEAERLIRLAADEAGWGAEIPRLDADEALAAEAAANQQQARDRALRLETARREGTLSAAYKAVASEELDAIAGELELTPPGSRNNQAFMSGLQAGRLGLPLDGVLAALHPVLVRLDPRDVDHHLDSLQRGWDRGHPRQRAPVGPPAEPAAMDLSSVAPTLAERLHAVSQALGDGGKLARALLSCNTFRVSVVHALTGEVFKQHNNLCRCRWCKEEYAKERPAVEAIVAATEGQQMLRLGPFQSWEEAYESADARQAHPMFFQAHPSAEIFGIALAPVGFCVSESARFVAQWWVKKITSPVREFHSLVDGDDPVGAARLVEYVPKGWRRFRRRKKDADEAPPHGWSASDQNLGKSILDPDYVEAEVPEGVPALCIVEHIPTGKVVFQTVYVHSGSPDRALRDAMGLYSLRE